MLTEIRLKPKRKLEIDEWVKKLEDALTSIPNSSSHIVRKSTGITFFSC